MDIWGGSSPLTRGKQQLTTWARDVARLIPAHAGKTRIRASVSSAVAAHPRSRGENAMDRVLLINAAGSSPLTRGKRLERDRRHRDERLIPAHAGKTSGWRIVNTRRPAHPRSRGENTS